MNDFQELDLFVFQNCWNNDAMNTKQSEPLTVLYPVSEDDIINSPKGRGITARYIVHSKKRWKCGKEEVFIELFKTIR